MKWFRRKPKEQPRINAMTAKTYNDWRWFWREQADLAERMGYHNTAAICLANSERFRERHCAALQAWLQQMSMVHEQIDDNEMYGIYCEVIDNTIFFSGKTLPGVPGVSLNNLLSSAGQSLPAHCVVSRSTHQV